MKENIGMEVPKGRMIVCVDFDGVIHSYKSGWQGATEIPDPPVDGAIEWLEKMVRDDRFDMCIYSSRSKENGARTAILKWLKDNGMSDMGRDRLQLPEKKPAAFITIDDRCICFDGKFPSANTIENFKPWYK